MYRNDKKKLIIYIIIHNNKNIIWKINLKKLKKIIKKNLFFINKINIIYIKNNKLKILKNIKNSYKYKFKKILLVPIFITKGNHLKIEFYKEIENILYIYNYLNIFFTENIGNYIFFIKIVKKFCISKINLIKNF